MLATVFRDISNAQCRCLRRGLECRTVLPSNVTLAFIGWSHTKERQGDIGASSAYQPSETQDFSMMDFKVDVLETCTLFGQAAYCQE